MMKRSGFTIFVTMFVLAMTWTLSPRAHAYFCGDPLSDACAPPESPSRAPNNSDRSSVHVENHPLSTFVLLPGLSLKDNFETWGKASGWKVLWRSEYTFPVKARYTAGGSFLGAVRRSVKIFNASSGGWLKVRAFMSNHVLLVEDGR